jgi:cyclopropane-fatty-acyl-phospholipid synthase
MTRHDRLIQDAAGDAAIDTSGFPGSLRIALMALRRVKAGRLDVGLPDGRTLRFEGRLPGPKAEIVVNDLAFLQPVLAKGDIGFADSYMAGRFTSPNLSDVFRYFSANWDEAGPLTAGAVLGRIVHTLQHMLRGNSKRGSRRNILAHYDLGNDFYQSWLDPSMTYSSALFDPKDLSLEAAQHAKYHSIARNLDLRPGMRILEIGCGWGGFAEVAASEYGAHVDCITISDAQFDYATQRIAAKGLSDKVRILKTDYRDVTGQYDGVASIEMFEAVGEKYWPSYFAKIAEVLKPGGRAALQIITIDDALFEDYRRSVDFIQAYIFPGGMLPSIPRLESECRDAGLGFAIDRMFGRDYAQTLATWNVNFQKAWDEIQAMGTGFDERFRRLWTYYLAYCEGGFDIGRIDVGQFVLTKPASEPSAL